MAPMTDRDLEYLVARAIASVPAARAPEEVLQAIRETHAVIERGRWDRVRSAADTANTWWKEGAYSDMATLHPGDLEP